MEKCGGPCSYSIWNTGLQVDVAYTPEDKTYFDEMLDSAWDYGKSAAIGAYSVACSYMDCLWPAIDAEEPRSDLESEEEKCSKLESKEMRMSSSAAALSLTGRSEG